MSDVFGTIVSRSQIDQAVLNLLSQPPAVGAAARIFYFLADVERQTGLTPHTLPPPPGPSSYRSEVGMDASRLEMMAEWLPLIGVDSQPTGHAERHDGGEYGQWYEIKVEAIVGDDDENLARMYADAYGAAVAAAILQKGSLGGIAQRTVMTSAPNVDYLDAETRQVSRATLTLESYVQPVVSDSAGQPTSWPADPYAVPAGLPEVSTVNTTVTGVSTLPE